jgi:hypothetical protein
MNFEPTYLYIKQHATTGKCYFGKTIKNDPIKYKGSGIHWSRHLKIHGKDHVETLWYCLFLDQEECTKFALMFSEQQDIVKSEDWLNSVPEDGMSGKGRLKGYKHSEETKMKISSSGKGKHFFTHSKATKMKMSSTRKGKKKSITHKQKLSTSQLGRSLSEEHKLALRKPKILKE